MTFSYSFNTRKRDKFNNVELNILLKLAFKQINPEGICFTGLYQDDRSAENNVQINKWLPSEWEEWKESFVRKVESTWDGKFWIMNDDQFQYTIGGTTYYPNIWCRLKVEVSDALPTCDYHGREYIPSPILPFERGHDHHHVVEVMKLDESNSSFRSHSTLYDNLDLDSTYKGQDSLDNGIYQITAAHEVGHLLGLDHINDNSPDCISKNDPACYGVTDRDRRSIMGIGSNLRFSDADPWRRCVIDHFHTGTLSNRVLSWPAYTWRIYPRTLAEVNRNVMVTALNLHRHR